MSTINERFKIIRTKLEMSQKDFGEKIGVSRDAIANIEGSRTVPKEIHVKSLCATLGISEKWLLTGEGDPKENILPLDTIQAAVEFASQRKNKPVPKLLAAMAEMYMEMDEVDRETTDKLLKQLLEKMK